MYSSISLALVGLLAGISAMPTAPPAINHARQNTPDIAAITSVNPSTFPKYHTGGLIRHDNNTAEGLVTRQSCATTPILTWGDANDGGPGLLITNGGSEYYGFYIYANSCDSIPYAYIWIAGGATEYVSLYAGFQGRITRGTDALNLAGVPQLLGTWFEFSFDSDGVIWGDVSLLEGCDGGVLMWATDGSGAWTGFTQDILANAPVGAWAEKPDGTWVLAPTVGATADVITMDYEIDAVGPAYAYISNSLGNPVISSSNGVFGVWFDPGYI